MGRLAAAMPRIFRVVITTQSRARSGRYNVVTHLRWWMGWREGGGVSPGQKLADPVSLSLDRSLAPFREVEDVVAYAMANSSSDQIIRAARVGRAWPNRGDRPFDCGVNNLLCFSHTMFGTLKNVRTFLYSTNCLDDVTSF